MQNLLSNSKFSPDNKLEINLRQIVGRLVRQLVRKYHSMACWTADSTLCGESPETIAVGGEPLVTPHILLELGLICTEKVHDKDGQP